MNTMTQDLKDSAASVLNDPFSKNSMIGLSTYSHRDLFNGEWRYRGKVSFKNGDTEGEQNFTAESLNGLLTKMQAFVLTLEEGSDAPATG